MQVNKIKKILFLTDNFPPEMNAPATRTYEHVREWVKKGYIVTVITCAPNFPNGKVFPGYNNKFLSTDVKDGIRIIRVWSYITANHGFLKRILDYISYAIMAFFVGLFIRTDIIIATSPQFFTAIAGRWLSLMKSKPWLMEVRDLWPESIAAVGAMNKSLLYNYLEWIEVRLYKSAKKIIVVTDAFKVNLIGKKIDPNKIFVHKNGVILDNFIPSNKDQDLLNQHSILKEKKVIAYIGTHGMAHGLSFVLDSLVILQKELPVVHFLFIGDGAEKQNLLRKADELKLINATFLPFVSKNDVFRYLSMIDVALVNLKKSDTFKSVIPSKIFEAAALGKPILLGLEGEAKGLVELYNAGLCFEPENSKDFVEKCKLIIDDNLYHKYEIGCLEMSRSFDRKKISLEMLETVTLNI